MSRIRLGTCSWKFPSWAGLVYSAAEGINYLEEYAKQYDTVEVDQWFWSLFGTGHPKLPAPADVGDYHQAVPSDFRFTVKVPNAITLTHHYPKDKSEPPELNPHFLSPDLFERFLSLIEPLDDVLGPIMLQFGYLNRKHLNGQSELLECLPGFFKELPVDARYGIEIRNARWLNAEHFAFIAEHRLVSVFLQGYWMPPVWETYDQHRNLLHEASTVVIRLHGPDREEMERETGKQWDTIVVERDEELQQVGEMAEELLDADVDVYLNVNNHYEGSAPHTIERIRAMLDARHDQRTSTP